MQTYNKFGLTRSEWVSLYGILAAIRLRSLLLGRPSTFARSGMKRSQSTIRLLRP